MNMTFALTLASGMSGPLPKWTHTSGVDTILVEKHDTPLVTVAIGFPSGAYDDPKGMEGLSYMTGEMLLAGTKKHRREEIENELDEMGAFLRVETGYHSTVLKGQVLRRNLDRLWALIEDVLTESTFPEVEVEKKRSETISKLIRSLEEDAGVAHDKFNDVIFGKHPYGRGLEGTPDTLKTIKQSDLTAYFAKVFRASGMLMGAAGDIDRTTFDHLAQRLMKRIPAGGAGGTQKQPVPALGEGRSVLLVDKPERTQTHFLIGQAGIDVQHPDYFPLMIFNTAFGGRFFQAKYLQEIRVKRGWAYGANSTIDTRRDGGAIYLYTFPAVKDTLPALKLSIELLDQAVNGNLLSNEDLEFVKTYIIRSNAFRTETPEKTLSEMILNRLVGLPDDYIATFIQRIQAVTLDQVREAARKHLGTKNLKIVVLCTAKDFRETIGAELSAKTVDVVPFDQF